MILVISLLPLLSLCFLSRVCAQDYSVPPEWQNTVSTISRTDRQSLAWEAARALQQRINPNTGYPLDTVTSGEPSNRSVANMLTVLATQDWRGNNDSWKEQVVDDTLAFYESGQEDLDNRQQNIDTATFGLAEIAAYLAYGKNSSRLEIAQRNFDIVHASFVNTSAAQNGVYTRPFNTTCGSTLGGLVFFFSNDSDLTVHNSAIGSWIALSARLYELTHNSTYLDAAEQSIQFMQTYIIHTDSDFIVSGIFDPTRCVITDESYSPDDIGFHIEGLSIVANITSNQTYTQMLDQLIPAILSYNKWHTDNNGILTADALYCSKGILMRGLLEARLRNPSNTRLVALIDSYLTVQFNAVETNALISDNDYAGSWRGGSYELPQTYTTVGQIDALDVLNSAFVIAPMTDISPSPSPSAPPSPHAKSFPTGPIVGATVGGTLAIAAFALVICICLRCRRRAREIPIRDGEIDTTSKLPGTLGAQFLAEPFILTAPVHKRSSQKGGFQQRRTALSRGSESSNNGTSTTPSSSPTPPVSVISITQGMPTIGETDALRALERSLMQERRRLDDLIESLANRGETESNPPAYEGDVTNHASAHDGRV